MTNDDLHSLIVENDSLRERLEAAEKNRDLWMAVAQNEASGHEATLAALTNARQEAAKAMRERAARRCRAYLKNTDILLSNPPQSSGVWQAYNAILAIPLPGEEQ
jgi:peptidoglycan hydrolase CwlO-like protein